MIKMHILHVASIYPDEKKYLQNRYVKYLVDGIEINDSRITNSLLHPIGYNPSQWCRKLFKGAAIRFLNDSKLNSKFFEMEIYEYVSIGRSALVHILLSKINMYINRKQIVNIKGSITHCHNIIPDGLIGLYRKKRLGIPYILTIQDERRMLRGVLQQALIRKVICEAYACTSHNRAMSYDVKKRYNVDVSVIPLGVDDKYIKKQRIKKGTRGNNVLRVLTVANLLDVKNYEITISAFDDAVKRFGCDSAYTICGDGPMWDRLAQLVKKMNLSSSVVMRGRCNEEEILQIMEETDIFILASKQESFGQAALEAYVNGIPIIITKNSGLWHYLGDRENVIGVNPSSREDIRDAIVEMKKRIEVGACQVYDQDCCDKYTWKSVAGEYMQIYNEALSATW